MKFYKVDKEMIHIFKLYSSHVLTVPNNNIFFLHVNVNKKEKIDILNDSSFPLYM